MSSWVCPSYSHCVETQKLRGPQGISSLNSVVSITDTVIYILFGDPEGSLLKFYYVKYMGIKSDDTTDFREHVIISYLQLLDPLVHAWAGMVFN